MTEVQVKKSGTDHVFAWLAAGAALVTILGAIFAFTRFINENVDPGTTNAPAQVLFPDTEPWTRINQSAAHTHKITSLEFSPDGQRLISGSYDHTAKVWDVETTATLVVLPPVTESYDGPGWVGGASFSPDAKWIGAVYSNGLIRFWDASTYESVGEQTSEIGGSYAATFTNGGKSFAIAHHSVIEAFNVEDHTSQAFGDAHTSSIMAIASSRDGSLLASGDSGKIALWQTDPWLARHVIPRTGGVQSVALSPDGSRVVAAIERAPARVWQTNDARELQVLTGQHKNYVAYAAVFLNSNRYAVTAGYDGKLRLWDVDEGRLLKEIESDIAAVALAISPNGEVLAVGGQGGEIEWWKVAAPTDEE